MKDSAKQTAAAWLEDRSAGQIYALAVICVGVVGLVDRVTGFELSFSIFYLIPIAMASWYNGRAAGFVLSLASAGCWLAADVTSGHRYSHATIPFWNAAVRFGFFIITAQLLAILHRQMQREQASARTDALTGLMNARAFRQEAQRFIGLAARHGRPAALAYLDLDNFKTVNDTLGHAQGDLVLKTVGGELQRHRRATDLAGRLGGDEFALLLPETEAAGARAVVESLHGKLVRTAAAHQWPIGVSIGVALDIGRATSVDAALHFADDLMYRVKRQGKNAIVFETYAANGQEPCAPRKGLP